MEIRNHFHFCPKCGIASLPSTNYRQFTCTSCDFQLYFNVGASVSGICQRENGDVLLLKRMHSPRAGTWTLPGGFVEPGESGIDSLKREIFEEIGLSVKNPLAHSAFSNNYVFDGIAYATFDVVYVCELSGEMRLDGTEVDGFRWFPIEELRSADISFASLKQSLDLYLSAFLPS